MNNVRHRAALALGLLCALSLAVHAGDRVAELAQAIEQIEARMPGNFGVYVKHLGSGDEVDHKANRLWYLSSTVKVPLAIAVLQRVEKKELTLDDRMELKQSHFVDGAGDLLRQKPGTRLPLDTLLEKSLVDSDSVATDMLIELLGEDAFNRQIRESMVATGFKPFTTILQVRYDAYAKLHPRASELSNMDYLKIRGAGATSARVETFRRKLDLSADQLEVDTLEEAFERYYQSELNSGTLVGFGELLERLVKGELLDAAHTDKMLGYMERITTGDKRLSAGLPEGTTLAQKTGTQIARACNVGVVHPRSLDKAVVVVACAEKYNALSEAERAFQELSKALERTGWL